jgi:hypothetical protein
MKAIICAEMDDFVSARDEWAHLVQASPGYAPARVNLAILTDSRMPKPPSTSKVSDLRGRALKFHLVNVSLTSGDYVSIQA